MQKMLFKLKIRFRNMKRSVELHPLFSPVRDLTRRYSDTDIPNSAAVSTYFILLALFPLLMVITEVLTLTSGGNLVNLLDDPQVQNMIPQQVLDLITGFVESSSAGQSVSLISFSVIGLIWSASRGFGAVIGGLNRAYMAPSTSSFLVRRVLGSVIILILGLSLVAVMIVLAFSEFILGAIRDITQRLRLPQIIDLDSLMVRVLPYAVAFAYLIFIFTAIYYFSSGRSGKIKHAALAGLFTTVVWLGFSFVYSIYINNYSNYSVVYGPLTAVILLLLYLYFSVQFLLIGAFLHREVLRFSGYSIYQKKSQD